MSLLINRCPESVQIGDKIYPINTSHRASILFELIITDPELDEYKIYNALKCYFNEIPEDVESAFEAAMWFYTLGNVNNDKLQGNYRSNVSQDSQAGLGSQKDIPYSFTHDDEYIFASFMQAYNIDLTEVDIHWWKFRPLFNSLPEDTIIKKIIEIREMKIDPKMSPEEKRNIRKLKRQYRLPVKKVDNFGDFMDSLF